MAKNSYGLERDCLFILGGKSPTFPNWSSFSRHMPSPYVSNSCGFSLNSVGGGGADLALCFINNLSELFLFSLY
jgi:hypothetical protein